jgi:hypothetical protein
MATLQQLETALRNADKAGDMDAARRLAQAVVQARGEAANQIPGAIVPFTEPQAPEPTLGQQLIGAGETALTLGTGAVGGTLGTLAGTLQGLSQQILSGQFGTPQAMRAVEQAAAKGAQALTYQPRTQAGQEQVQAVGQVLSNVLPPVLPAIAAPGAVMQAARTAAPTVGAARQIGTAAGQRAATATGQAIARPVQAATTAVRETLGMETPAAAPAAGARVSGGAAATPLELQRAQEAEMAGLRLTEGEMKRDPTLLDFEKEKAKTAEFQAPFVQRQQENNRAALGKLNQVLDDTGAESGDYANTGIKVVDTLMAGWDLEKKKTNALYNKFRESPESQIAVDTTPVLEFLNSQAKGVAGVTGVPDTARQNAVNLGIAQIDDGGKLIANPNVTLGQLEDFRQSVSAISAANPNDKRLASILKRQIDDIGDPIGGEMTKSMRAQRQRQAQKYENRAIVSRLLLEKKGMSDAQTPIEDVFRKTILSARPSEIQHLKRVLSTIPDQEGQQAWKELQGATVRHLLEKSEAGIGSDNLPVISGAKLDNALRQFDQNGKLDQVMGVSAAEQIRNLNQVLKYIQSTPPLTNINNSGSARTIAALIAESAIQGAAFGVPLPVVQGMKMLRDNVADRRIKARITKALNYKPNTSTALPPVQP